jgi:hypothetical protein
MEPFAIRKCWSLSAPVRPFAYAYRDEKAGHDDDRSTTTTGWEWVVVDNRRPLSAVSSSWP